jgi:hypothetical protein
MKKIFFLISITFLILQSCSSGDNSNSSDSNQELLIKKIVPVNAITTDDIIQTFSYNGNKLQKVTYEQGTYLGILIFTYTGDYITKIERRFANNNFSGYYAISYSGNNVSQVKYFNSNNIMTIQEDYTYRGNRTYTVNIKRYDDLGVYNYGYIEKLYLDSDGNLVKYEKFDSKNIVVKTLTYTFDSQNGIYKNILGFNYLPRGTAKGGLPYLLGHYNNEIGVVQGSSKSTSQFQYNSQNYPISATYFNSSGVKRGTFQFIY